MCDWLDKSQYWYIQDNLRLELLIHVFKYWLPHLCLKLQYIRTFYQFLFAMRLVVELAAQCPYNKWRWSPRLIYYIALCNIYESCILPHCHTCHKIGCNLEMESVPSVKGSRYPFWILVMAFNSWRNDGARTSLPGITLTLNVRGPNSSLTYWGRVTHICVTELTVIGQNNRLSPVRRLSII